MTDSTKPNADSNPPKPSGTNPSADQDTKTRKEIHVVSIPNEQEMIAEEMAELFEEDQVTHQHGSAEPEGD